jgi:hypothetical protein
LTKSGQDWQNTEGVRKCCFDVKYDYKIKKNKKKTVQNTVLPPTHRQKPTHEKPNGGGYAAAQTFCEMKKGIRSSIEQNEIKQKTKKIKYID